MRTRTRLVAALVGLALFGPPAPAQAKKLIATPGPQRPSTLVGRADVVFVGNVIDVEKGTVEATQSRGAPKDQKISYKVAVVKIEDGIIGGKGLTQFRVGFPADAAATPAPSAGGVAPGVGGRIRPIGIAPVALLVGEEGCFFLTQHHDADFYILASDAMGFLNKKDENYTKQLDEVKKLAKALDDPVAALKAKELNDRFVAATVILRKYQTPRRPGKPGASAREPIPDEENKLIVSLLTELPWIPKDATSGGPGGDIPPSRSAIWTLINPVELGFKQPTVGPKVPGDTAVDYNTVMDEATTKFLKENGEKIKIKRYVDR
ncbi:MAG TPA: hypothetical protein VKE40_25555 [Gemmataceae bacterium]|nr:hypothetical protein [Gemmataceae bacterium]